jgi:hypothetical protein
MNTCETCGHWKRHDWRVEMQQRNGGVWGLCTRLTSSDEGPDHRDIRPAEAVDFSEGIGGDFVTRPEFGCTEWIPSNAEAQTRRKAT